MNNNSQAKTPKGVIFADIFSAIFAFIAWSIVWGVTDALFGWIFQRSAVSSTLWSLSSMGSFILVVCTSVSSTHKREMAAFNPQETAPTTVLDLMAEEEAPTEENFETVVCQTAVIRGALIKDIEACLFDADYTWQWADKSTVSRIIAYFQNRRNVAYSGRIHVVNDRVDVVYVTVNGKEKAFYNQALIVAQQAEKAASIDATIKDFLNRVLPDAKWFWDNPEAGTIHLTSEKLGVEEAIAKFKYSKSDGHITSMDVSMPGGETKNIKNRASQSSSKVVKKHKKESPVLELNTSANTGDEQQDSKVKKTNHSKTKSSIVAAKKVSQPVEVMPLAEETKANLLQPTDIPPVSDDVLKRAAYQLAEDDALEICQLAIAAAESGETSFFRHWPEGLQTKKEAEYYAEAIVSKGDFVSADIDAETQTVEFHIAVDDCYA